MKSPSQPQSFLILNPCLMSGLTQNFEYAILAYLLARALLWRGAFNRGQLFTVFYLVLLAPSRTSFTSSPGAGVQVVDCWNLGAVLGLSLHALPQAVR